MVYKPWASPRAWTRFSNLLRPLRSGQEESRIPTISPICPLAHVGKIGKWGFLSRIIRFHKLRLKRIMDYKKFEIPKNPVRQYAACVCYCHEFCGVSPNIARKEKVCGKLDRHFGNAFKKSTNNVSELPL